MPDALIQTEPHHIADGMNRNHHGEPEDEERGDVSNIERSLRNEDENIAGILRNEDVLHSDDDNHDNDEEHVEDDHGEEEMEKRDLFDKPVRGLDLEPWNPDEFPQWKKSVGWTFDINNMLGILNGTEKCPVPPTHPVKIKDWVKRNKFACQALLRCIKGPTKSELLKYTSAHEMWKALDELHAQPNSVRLSDLDDQMQALRLQPGQTINQHILEFDRLRQAVNANARHPLDDETVNVRFLKSLGESWRQFHQNNIVNIPNWKPTFLYEQVRAFMGPDIKQPAPSTSANPASVAPPIATPEAPAALAQVHATNYEGKGKGKAKRGGNYSKYNGKGKKYNPYNSNRKSRWCVVHKIPTHWTSDCRIVKSLKPGENGSNRRNGYGNGGNAKNDEGEVRFNHWNRQANVSYFCPSAEFKSPCSQNPQVNQTSLRSVDPYEWLVDTAANASITPFQERLHNYIEFTRNGTVAGLAGKTEAVLGLGNLVFRNPLGYSYQIRGVLYVPNALNQILSMCHLIDLNLRFYFTNWATKDFKLVAVNFPFRIYGYSEA